MTLTVDTESDASREAVAERVRKIREAQDTGVSRAEGWRRRGPLLPALIFMIVVTQIPFLFTLYYSTLSWNLVRPGSRQFVGLNNYIAVVQDSQFWTVALNTVVLIVVVVLVSANMLKLAKRIVSQKTSTTRNGMGMVSPALANSSKRVFARSVLASIALARNER